MTDLQKLVESVSEAVAAIIIFSAEGSASKTMLPNVSTASVALKRAIDIFYEGGLKKVGLWRKIGIDQVCMLTGFNRSLQSI